MRAIDLKRGQWVTVTDFRSRAKIYGEDTYFITPHIEYLGVPGKVVAVNLPFILIQSVGGDVEALDTRCRSFVLLTKSYVKHYTASIGGNPIHRCTHCRKPIEDNGGAAVCHECSLEESE